MTETTMTPFCSAPASQAIEKAQLAAFDAGKTLSDAELRAIGEEADRKATFGWNYQVDKHNNPIQQGVGSPGHETANHFAALKKRESMGQERPGTHDRLVGDLWKRDPARAKALNLPAPARAGS
jgi:hypothetical protein